MNFIHTSAIVDSGAGVGDLTSIWHFCNIESGAVVGKNCNLGQNAYVGNNATAGNACRLGNSVSIFSHVELGDFVFCVPLMGFTHISFPRAAVNRHDVFQKAIVKTGVTPGANATVIPEITIGIGTFLAAGSSLTKSCKDWALMVGVPARQVGWVSAFGEKINLPLTGQEEWNCVHTGDVYVLDESVLTRISGTCDILKNSYGQKLVRMKSQV